jgi:phage I-like protein
MPTPAAPSRLALTPLSVALAALGEDGAPRAPSEIRLVPAGMFRARDGRPAGVDGWRMDAESGAACIAHAAAQRDDAVIDYEHQTLLSAQNGQPAPAAGWISAGGLEYRDAPAEQGGGLWATALRWTQRAAQMVAAAEYRYLSPVIAWDRQTGSVRAVTMAALTNHPALDGLTDLTPLAALSAGLTLPTLPEESDMDLDALRKALALPGDADEAAILAAVEALAAKAGETETQLTALRADLDAAKRETKPDLSQYVPRAVHDEALAALRAQTAGSTARELDQLITDGLADGRIPGKATADWLRGLGLDACREYLADAQPIAALTRTQVDAGGKGPAGSGADEFTDALAAEFGSREAWEAYRTAERAGNVKIYRGDAR